MLPYFIPPFLALLGAIYNRRLTANSLKLLYWLTTLSALFFYCCVYMNGADWPEYEMIYNELTWENLFQIASDRKFEIGFCFLMLLFKAIGFGFFPFLIIAKSFSLIVISNFFKSYAINYGRGYSSNVFFLLLIFYLGSCMYLYVETIIRFSLALAIVVFAYKYLLNKRFFLFLFWLLIAITFHKSAILLLPIYFINNITFSKYFVNFHFLWTLIFHKSYCRLKNEKNPHTRFTDPVQAKDYQHKKYQLSHILLNLYLKYTTSI